MPASELPSAQGRFIRKVTSQAPRRNCEFKSYTAPALLNIIAGLVDPKFPSLELSVLRPSVELGLLMN